jgi:protein-S-isoprenylcysteine O-methyltransferase Ste14
VSSSTESGSSSGRTVAAVVLGVIALVFIVAGIVYIAVPAGSLPGFMGHVADSTGHHPLRAAGCLIVGVVFAIGAWFALKYRGKAATPADASSKEPAAR